MRSREGIILLLFTLAAVITNQFIPLYSDESYYWIWSKKLALSYFDHPPMVAYLIKMTTLFGDSAAEIRMSAPLLMAGTAYLLYALAKRAYGEKTAIFVFYIFLTTLMIQGASTIITPDIPLIFFWTLTLYCAYRYIIEEERNYALWMGIFGGMLLLSKYTGILLLISILLTILLTKRSLFKDKYLYAAIVLCLVVFSPVIYWNYLHDFLSFKFQLGHGIAHGDEKAFRSKEFFNFLGAQLLLLHPLYILPLFYFMFVQKRELFERKNLFFLLPFLFPLAFFTYFAAFKQANAQWAIPAYLSGVILLGGYLARRESKRLIIAAALVTLFVTLLIKTPLGDTIKPVKNFKARTGKIENFKEEIEKLQLDINKYNYLIIDDYHGTDVGYYFGKYDNLLVLAPARFSQFNIWRYEELGISIDSPVKTLPKLGKMIYIGISDLHVWELDQLLGKGKVLMSEKKQVGGRVMSLYAVEYSN